MSVILCLTAQFFITFKAPIQYIVDFTMPSFLAFIAPKLPSCINLVLKIFIRDETRKELLHRGFPSDT